jgi:hypothetical protein
MGAEEPKDLGGVVEEITESGSKAKTKSALEGGVDKLRELVGSDSERSGGQRGERGRQRQPARRRGKQGRGKEDRQR